MTATNRFASNPPPPSPDGPSFMGVVVIWLLGFCVGGVIVWLILPRREVLIDNVVTKTEKEIVKIKVPVPGPTVEIQVEKVVEKLVDRVVEVPAVKIVEKEKVVYRDKIVEKIVRVEVPIEKIVEREVYIELYSPSRMRPWKR